MENMKMKKETNNSQFVSHITKKKTIGKMKMEINNLQGNTWRTPHHKFHH